MTRRLESIIMSIGLFSAVLSAQSPVFFVNTFDAPPTLASSQTADAWYPDRYPPAIFEQFNVSGENMLHIGIRLTDSYMNRPPANRSSFYNTHGRKYDLGSGNSFSTALTADLYVGVDWNTKHRMATMWSTACDSTGAISFYNIMGFRNATGADPGFYIYGYQNTNVYTLLPFTITYGQWYSVKIELTDTAFVYSINGTVVLSDTTLNGTKYFSNLILQAYSFADSTLPAENRAFEEYDVFWDNVGAVNTAVIAPVALLTAGNFRILAGSAVTIGPGTAVTGNVGVSPGSAVTNGGTVTGSIHQNDAAAIQAQNDLAAAYDDAAGRTNAAMVATELGGTTLGRGVYISASGTFEITGTLTLSGTPSDVFIFKTATTLITGAGSSVILTGGAHASNVFWQVGSSATIDGDFKGNILAFTAITQNSGATIDGRALARNGAVTVNGTSVLPVERVALMAPQEFGLFQNYPNPFNPATTLSFSLPSKSQVLLNVFDALGREVSVVLSEELSAGKYSLQWNAGELPSGIYFCRLAANAVSSEQGGSFTETRKLLLLR